MMRRMLVLAGLLSVFTHTGALAQVRGAPTRVDTTVKARPDTARRDSTRADSASSRELVKWNEPDSVMQSLMTRPGYTPTKYQGDRAVFDARTHTLELEGNKAAVNREHPHFRALLSLAEREPSLAAYCLARCLLLDRDQGLAFDTPLMEAATELPHPSAGA